MTLRGGGVGGGGRAIPGNIGYEKLLASFVFTREMYSSGICPPVAYKLRHKKRSVHMRKETEIKDKCDSRVESIGKHLT